MKNRRLDTGNAKVLVMILAIVAIVITPGVLSALFMPDSWCNSSHVLLKAYSSYMLLIVTLIAVVLVSLIISAVVYALFHFVDWLFPEKN